MDNMTDKERRVVKELEKRTLNDVTPKMLEDVSLFYRFAKGRDFNIDEAENMLRKHISWRKEMDIDTILTNYEPPEVLAKYAPTSFLCYDKEGSIVRVTDCGRADIKALWNVVQKKDWVKFLAFIIEQDMERIIKRGGNLGNPMYVAIDDFEDLVYADAMSIKNLQYVLFLLKTFLDNYPEVLKTVTLINIPSYFSWIYAVIKPILPLAVSQKVRMFGRVGWREILIKEIDSDKLPAYLGGEKTDPDGNPLCKTLVHRGETIPKKYYLQNRTKKLSFESDVEKLTLMPFSKQEICFEVKERDSYLEWEFETKNKDIDFSLIFKRFSDSKVIIPKQRIDATNESEKGSFKCENIGIYKIVFDNSYSWIHSKEVYYRAGIKTLMIDAVDSSI